MDDERGIMMAKYQAEFFRPGKKQRRFVEVTLTPEETAEETAYRVLLNVPQIKGTRHDWNLLALVKCDSPIRAANSAEMTVQLTSRIVRKIEDGIYRVGQLLPNPSVWAAQLGLNNAALLYEAVPKIRDAGYLTLIGNGHYVRPKKYWKPDRIQTPKPE